MTKLLNTTSRRMLLAWLTAGIIVTPAWARPIHGGAASGSSSGLMSAQIVLSGTTYTYTESGGANLGNYVGPSWTQKNIKGATASGIPNFYVLFRQDTTGGRKEVVFGNYSSGNLTSMSVPVPPVNTAVNLGSFTVQIFTNGVLETGGFIGAAPVASSPVWSAGTITPPSHWFASEWRWQSALRPIINTPTTIMSNGWMLNMGTSGVSATIRGYDNSPNVYYSPMDAAGMVQGMHQTGGRPDIGLLTEWSAQWMIDPNGNHGVTTEFAMRSGAEAAHSIPQCVRDDATGAPINFITYPIANWYTAALQGYPRLLYPGDISPTNGWDVATDHFPSNSYIAFAATGDRYYLEGTIFEITGALLAVGHTSGGVTVYDYDQDRSWAWEYRSGGMAYVALKIAEGWGSLPSDLPPSSSWASIANASTDFFYNNYANNMSNPSKPFGSGVATQSTETWESEFEVISFNWFKKAVAAVGGTFTNLAGITTYKSQGTIDRTSGSTGWPVAFPVPYAMAYNYTGSYATTWSGNWTQFWQGQTAEFNGYIDVPNSQLVVTSMNNGSRAQNYMVSNAESGGSSWKLAAGTFLHQLPLSAFDILSRVSGMAGGPGVFNIISDQYFGGGRGWSVPTQSPCNVSFDPSIDPGMPVNQKFRFIPYSGSLPAPLSPSTDYYVTSINSGANSFQFSDTLGGTPINVTGTRTDPVQIMPYVGTSGTPVAMSEGNQGNSMSMLIPPLLAGDQYNSGFFAQGNGDYDYLVDTQAALASASQNSQSGASAAFAHANTMSGNAGNIMYYRFCFTP